MVIEEKMKLNKFQQVSIPKPSDMFARLGFRQTPASEFAGDQTLPTGNKVDQLGEQMKMYEQYAEEEARKAAQKQDAE